MEITRNKFHISWHTISAAPREIMRIPVWLLMAITIFPFPVALSATLQVRGRRCQTLNVYQPAKLLAGGSLSIELFNVDVPNTDVKDVKAVRVEAATEFQKHLEKIKSFTSVVVVPDNSTHQKTDLYLQGSITRLKAARGRLIRAATGLKSYGAYARVSGTVRSRSGDVLLDFECDGKELGGLGLAGPNLFTPVGLVGAGVVASLLESSKGRMRKNFSIFAEHLAKSFKRIDKVYQKRSKKGTKKRKPSEGETHARKADWREQDVADWTPKDHAKEVGVFVVKTKNKNWFRVHALWLTSSAVRSFKFLADSPVVSVKDLPDGLPPELEPVQHLMGLQNAYLIAVTFENGAAMTGGCRGCLRRPPFFWNDNAVLKSTYISDPGDGGEKIAPVKMVNLESYLKERGHADTPWRNHPVIFVFPTRAADGKPLVRSLNDDIILHTKLEGQAARVSFRLSDFGLASKNALLPH